MWKVNVIYLFLCVSLLSLQRLSAHRRWARLSYKSNYSNLFEIRTLITKSYQQSWLSRLCVKLRNSCRLCVRNQKVFVIYQLAFYTPFFTASPSSVACTDWLKKWVSSLSSLAYMYAYELFIGTKVWFFLDMAKKFIVYLLIWQFDLSGGKWWDFWLYWYRNYEKTFLEKFFFVTLWAMMNWFLLSHAEANSAFQFHAEATDSGISRRGDSANFVVLLHSVAYLYKTSISSCIFSLTSA